MDFEHERTPEFSPEEDELIEYLADNYTVRKSVAICDSIPHELAYVRSSHSKLLDLMQLAQFETPNGNLSLEASLEEYRSDKESTARYAFAAQGFCGDVPYTISLNEAPSHEDITFTLRYALIDRKGYLDSAPASEYELTASDESITFQQLSIFLYGILRQETIGGTSERAEKLILTALEQPNFALIAQMIEQIGDSYGNYIEQLSKETLYPDSADRSLSMELTTIEHNDGTQRILKTSASHFPAQALAKVAKVITIEKQSQTMNVPKNSDTSDFSVTMRVNRGEPAEIRPEAVFATLDGLSFLTTNTVIEESL